MTVPPPASVHSPPSTLTYLITENASSVERVRLRKMRSALDLLLTALVVTYFPVAVVSFCSTSATQHQLHKASAWPHAHTARASAVGTAAAPAADNMPTTPTHPVNELGGDDDSSSVDVSSSSSSERFESFAKFLMETQAAICLQAEASDGRASFCTDRWEREGASKVGLCWARSRAYVLMGVDVRVPYSCAWTRVCNHGSSIGRRPLKVSEMSRYVCTYSSIAGAVQHFWLRSPVFCKPLLDVRPIKCGICGMPCTCRASASPVSWRAASCWRKRPAACP